MPSAADEELARARRRRSRPRAGSPSTTRRAARSAASVRNGAGASSTSFWCRRCSEQSRVETTTTVPCSSARHCVSTCRGRSRYRSTKHSPRPNAAMASRTADSNISSISSTVRATLRPRPPPPNAALIAMGRPCSAANAWISSTPCDGVGGAGDQGCAGALRDVAGADLVAERLDRRRRRADPREAGVDDGLRERRVLGEEAVPGVHGVGAGAAGDVEQLGRCRGRSRRRGRRRARTPRRRGGRAAASRSVSA